MDNQPPSGGCELKPKDDEDAGVPREKARENAQNLLQILKKKQAEGEERKAAWLNA